MATVVITAGPSTSSVKPVVGVASPGQTAVVRPGISTQGPQGIEGEQGVQGPIGPEGPEGPQGPAGTQISGTGDLTYDHYQASASATWVIPHGLGKHPTVVVIDSSGSECEGLTSYDSLNQITLTFSAAFGGHAYLN